jgi:two-component system, sensor histidine kinase ChiS
LGAIKRNIEKLERDIVNYFDLHKLDNQFELYHHHAPQNISSLADERGEFFKVLFLEKKLAFTSSIDKNIYVVCDPDSIVRVLNNILENALKYTPSGGTVHFSLKINDDMAIISIENSGIGIPDECKDKIFQPYFQVQQQKKQNQGLGLGLPMVKKIVDSLNGTILVEDSVNNKGTHIEVILRRHLTDLEKSTQSHFSNTDMGRKLLLVEDNIEMADFLREQFSFSYDVSVANSGAEALRILEQFKLPDIIISDVMMDDIDGIRMAEIIAEKDYLNHIPIIFVTAKTDISDKIYALGLGAIDYVNKPFSFEELSLKVNAVLDYSEKIKQKIIKDKFSGYNDSSSPAITSAQEVDYSQYHLTNREIQIAKLVCQGLSYSEIGKQLFISDRTVSKHVQHIFEKVSVKNKIELLKKVSSS